MQTEKVEKLIANLHNKEEYVIQIRSLEQVLNHKLVLQKVHSVNRGGSRTAATSKMELFVIIVNG